jgi:O-antigen/teichoic acid export membrane protein
MRKILLPCILILFVLLGGCAPVRSDVDERETAIKAYYAGPTGGTRGVRTAVDLARDAGLVNLVGDPAQADVLVLNGQIPDPAGMAAHVWDGAGLVLVLGPEVTSAQASTLLGQDVVVNPRDEALSLMSAPDAGSALLQDIVWGSAPQVRERSILAGIQAAPVIVGYESDEALLIEMQAGKGTVYVFTSYLDGVNSQFQEWPYFNYVVYDLAARAAGRTPLSFGDYPASPVPHAREQGWLVAVCAALVVTAFAVFWGVRRYSLAHPEALDELVASREHFEAREAGTAWEEVGFHRPLAGFLFAMMMGVLLFIPLIIYQNMILPAFILPSAQAFGLMGRVGQVFALAWTLFDVGTSVAFIKFFAQYRVRDPRRAVQYGQVFVWWQALSGAFQVALVVILAGTMVPRTSYAIYTWIIIAHTVIQIPGFYRVMRDAMYAQQRLDYAQVLDNFIMLLWPMVNQPIFVLLMLWWGRRMPAIGPALGGAIGLAVAAYAVQVCNFVLGLWLYRRVGYSARIFFLAHFDWAVLKEAFGFGALDMGGSLVLAAGSAIEILITQTRLINYAEVWGNWMMANNFMLAFDVLRNLVDGVMPAISEAISHGRRKLCQYYVTMTYKWDAMAGAFVAAVLLAIADRFILGSSGPEFARAAVYVLPLIVFGSFQHLNIIGDAVVLASNRPGIKMVMITIEQTVRIVLALLLLKQFQVTGLIVAYLVATLARGIAIYFINSRVCFPLRYYFWQSLAAPVLAGTVHFVILRWVTGLIWQGEEITSIVIFLVGILFSIPLYSFWYGLFGGWDDATLNEFRRAAGMQPFLGFMSRWFYQSSALGARLSPLHNRFPITIREAAMEEARSLTAERVSLAGE